MRVVPFGNTRVGVTELLGNHPHWNACHCQCGGVRMAQYVEPYRRPDGGPIAGITDRPGLLRGSPPPPVFPQKHVGVTLSTRS